MEANLSSPHYLFNGLLSFILYSYDSQTIPLHSFSIIKFCDVKHKY